jgi:hypothetical protein
MPVDRVDQLRLAHAEGTITELHQYALKELNRRYLRLRDPGDSDGFIQLGEEFLEQRGLPAADFAGNDDEPISEPEGRFNGTDARSAGRTLDT